MTAILQEFEMKLLALLSSWLSWGMLQTSGAASPTKNLSFLFAAYVVVWLLIVGYLFSLSRRQKRLAQEVETLKQMREEK
jgi:CcmD family protein